MSLEFRRWTLATALAVGRVAAGPADAGDLALKRVMLSTGGVGYLEYEAEVDGDAILTLEVGLDQVDDVLKSLIVYDTGGTAGEITLPGREPLTQSFADLPFDRTALESATALFNALQGSEIRVAGVRPITGRLIHVTDESVRAPDGTVQTRSRAAVLTESGVQQFVLQDAESIAFVDPELQAKVKTALTRIAAYRAEARRKLTLTTHGKGKRTIRVGYVVAMPLWKASYRLSLTANPTAEKARLQGWAVLENFSGQAWHDVDLTLLSGNPVTFRQALYESYYVPRQTVPVESGGRVLPPADTGTLGRAEERMAKAEQSLDLPYRMRGVTAAPGAAPAPPPPAPAPVPARIEAAQAEEGTTQIAFTLPAKVSVGVGQSLALPLLDRDLPARRLDLYQPGVSAEHPLAAIELTNASGSGLPPGVLTLYEQGEHGATYLGDARLAAFPIGEKRLLSFAVDGKVAIDRGVAEQRHVVKAAVAEGVMRITRTERRTTTYRVKAAVAPPLLLIEQPRLGGWTLAQPDPKTVELTAGAYRIPVAPGKETTVAVVEERPLEESVRLLDLSDSQLAVYVASKELDPKLHQALADLVSRRQALAGRRTELERLKAHRAELIKDESRLRDNLAALPTEAPLRQRVLDKLSNAETEIDATAAAIEKALSAVEAAEKELATHVAGLKL